MSEKLARILKLKRERFIMEISGVIAKQLCESSRVNIRLYPWFAEQMGNGIFTNFIVLKKLPEAKHFNYEREIPEFENILLADPQFNKSSTFHLLLGVEFWAKIIRDHVIHSSVGLCAQNTTFGYVVFGSISLGNGSELSKISLNTAIDEQNTYVMNELLARFWELNDPIESKYTAAEEKVERYFVETTTRDLEGRFVVRIPFKDNDEELGESRTIALKRFFQIERRLERDKELRKNYNKFMQEFIDLGHMRRATNCEKRANGYYIPHHAVTKKFRVVFDASCVTNNGKSLNDVQLAGPNLQENLAMVIMRFRLHRIVFATDVRKMFRQFKIHKDDLKFQKIIWRFDSNEPLSEYVILTVVYGMKASPFLAMRCMYELAKIYKKEYPMAARATELERYMDDYFSGADNEEQIVRLYNELREMLGHAGLELGKWKTNCPALIERINRDLVDYSESVDLNDEFSSILGLKWIPASDCFLFQVNTEVDNEMIITKRVVTSNVAKLYDPNGYLGPVIVQGKLFIQQLWILKLEWDEPLCEQNVKVWMDFHKQLILLNKVRIPRWLQTTATRRIELIGFADASAKAYGAVIYVRTFDDNFISCQLLTSKSRVAPLKEISIPRLELCAVELLVKLMNEVRSQCELKYVRYYMFTDSMIVLRWIKKDATNFKTFVANRILIIQKYSQDDVWHHVPTNMNPADLLSRGMSTSELLNCSLWWNGPEFIKESYDKWPRAKLDFHPDQLLLDRGEYKASVLWVKTAIKSDEWLTIGNLPLIERYSSLSKVVRITAYINIAISRFKKGNERDDVIGFSNQQLNDALEYWIKYTQKLYFWSDMQAIHVNGTLNDKSSLVNLKPFLDDSGIMRVWGRIENAQVNYDERHPVIIPEHSIFARLLMKEAHEKTKHGNVQIMLHYVRAKYWILHSKRVALRVTKSCVRCIRFSQEDKQQLMADLPCERLSVAPPFTYCGVDYFGPVKLKRYEGRCNTIVQGYIAVFVCMTTKIIHLECCTDLTTEKFIWAFTRFSSIYGTPMKMLSDNGKTFVGAKNELQKIMDSWQSKEMCEYLMQHNVQWKFITPKAPNQGGLWEAAVKSTKFHLKRILSEISLTYERYQTVLAGVSAVLNSRPLVPLSDNPLDLNYLTPAHAYTGGRIIRPLTRNLSDLSPSVIKHKRMMDKMNLDFWNSFRKDYLSTLQTRYKWNTPSENLKINDFVIIKEDNVPPGQWNVARVIEVFPGEDGLVRNVHLRTARTEFSRPVRKLVRLFISDEDQEKTQTTKFAN